MRPAKLVDAYLREGSPRARRRGALCGNTSSRRRGPGSAWTRPSRRGRPERSLEARDVCLYVGIPFCPTRCAYCSFVSQSVREEHKAHRALHGRAHAGYQATAAQLRRAGLRPVSSYMGGGTPTTLSAAQLDRLCGKLEREFDLSPCGSTPLRPGGRTR